jgi:hypothetical protein
MAQSSPDRPGGASVTAQAAALPTSALLGRGERGAANEKLSQQINITVSGRLAMVLW